jgi:hypothetical protein
MRKRVIGHAINDEIHVSVQGGELIGTAISGSVERRSSREALPQTMRRSRCPIHAFPADLRTSRVLGDGSFIWNTVAAVHDAFWSGGVINPWPLSLGLQLPILVSFSNLLTSYHHPFHNDEPHECHRRLQGHDLYVDPAST